MSGGTSSVCVCVCVCVEGIAERGRGGRGKRQYLGGIQNGALASIFHHGCVRKYMCYKYR